jgi:hypothetical protein
MLLTPRRRAQVVITAACLTLVSTFTILIAGSDDSSKASKPSTNNTPSRITPLATEQLGMTSSTDSVRLTMAK